MKPILRWRDVLDGLYHPHDWAKATWAKYGIIGYLDFLKMSIADEPSPILNAASGQDPVELWKLGAINLDILDSGAPNYTKGTIFDLPFEEGSIGTVVCSEFLEHCKMESAIHAMSECRRVLRKEGHLILTIPLDGRPVKEQAVLDIMAKKDSQSSMTGQSEEVFTGHHQTWWGNEMLDDLCDKAGMVEVHRRPLCYPMTSYIGGWGLIWEKP